MAGLKTIELKFVLKLLGCEDYQGKITALKPNSGTSASERDRICKALSGRGLVEYSSKIDRFSLDSAGRTLLGLDTTSLPVTPDELKLLKACKGKKGYATPGEVSGIAADSGQDLVTSLAERGMVKVSKDSIQEVWLTAQGKQFLLHEYEPSGNYFAAASATMIGSYVKFLRENLGKETSGYSSGLPTGQPGRQSPSAIPIGSQAKPDAQAVLQKIKQLDPIYGNKNYLPIYHLRDNLQPSLSRAELDSILYTLQREGQIDLDSLHDQGQYTKEQMAMGIHQDNGGYLFFISVL